MNKKIIGFFIVMLLISTVFLPIASTKNNYSFEDYKNGNIYDRKLYDNPIEPVGIWSKKLDAPGGGQDDLFGISVSISGDYAIVGAPHFYNDNKICTGAAFIFKLENTGWVYNRMLTASDGSKDDNFGHSVSISGDYAIVGAPHYSSWSGAVYIFKRNGDEWIEQPILQASNIQHLAQFGHSVSISGDYAIVGALYHDNENGENAGTVYIFKNNNQGWGDEVTKIDPYGAPEDNFGYSVGIDRDKAIIGSPFDDGWGSATVFKFNGEDWLWDGKLDSDSINNIDDYFGISVAISGDYAIVGEPLDDKDIFGRSINNCGAAYLFVRSTSGWTPPYKVEDSFPHYPTGEEGLGWSVSISGDYAIIGKPNPYNIWKCGEAYIYKRVMNDWKLISRVFDTQGELDDNFGHSVSTDGKYVIIGAPWDEEKRGSVIFFKIVELNPSFLQLLSTMWRILYWAINVVNWIKPPSN
jgi:hypothetical protein